MKTISETNVDEIYSRTADWYIILLEDNWQDAFRDELYNNVDYLAEAVCPKIWVIRGHRRKRDEFFSAIYHRYGLYLGEYSFERFPRPALLVTNSAPLPKDVPGEELDKVIRIIFPLSEHYVKPGSISAFLQNLSISLQKPDALESLQSLNEKKFMETWGWLLDCFEIKPSFLGIVSFDVNKFIKQIMKG